MDRFGPQFYEASASEAERKRRGRIYALCSQRQSWRRKLTQTDVCGFACTRSFYSIPLRSPLILMTMIQIPRMLPRKKLRTPAHWAARFRPFV